MLKMIGNLPGAPKLPLLLVYLVVVWLGVGGTEGSRNKGEYNIIIPVVDYRLEDFFWTGSGDGGAPDTDNHHPRVEKSSATSTVFRTSTVLATVYVVPSTPIVQPADPQCVINCEKPREQGGTIAPTGTIRNGNASTYRPPPPTDRRYWLLTIVSGGVYTAFDWESKLAKLYSMAFSRQQDRHLGLLNNTKTPNQNRKTKRSTMLQILHNNSSAPNLNDTAFNVAKREVTPKPDVLVYLHNVTHYHVNQDLENNSIDQEYTELLYSVLVGGQPVLAVTAANDMNLVSDVEVMDELGYNVLTKSEPYLKSVERSSWGVGTAFERQPWVIVVIVIGACLLLVMLIALILFAGYKRKHKNVLIDRSTSVRDENTPIGVDNHGFANDNMDHKTSYLGKLPVLAPLQRTSNKSWPITNQSSSSLDSPLYTPGNKVATDNVQQLSNVIAPPVREPRHRHKKSSKRKHSKKHHRGRYNNAVGVDWTPSERDRALMEQHEFSDQNLSEALMERKKMSSPGGSVGSYLSMPSIKSFPRCDVPEPLSRVLEPMSVHHLDWEGEGIPIQIPPPPTEPLKPSTLSRHLSVGSADPGVIGPVVWDLHKRNIQNISPVKKNQNQSLSPRHVAIPMNPQKANRRYRGLIDDALDHWTTPSDVDPMKSPLKMGATRPYTDTARGRSAVVKSNTGVDSSLPALRPRSAAHDNQEEVMKPTPSRGAWGSGGPSPLVRPLSAGPFHRPPSPPQVDVARIMAPQPEFQDTPSILETIQSTSSITNAIQVELQKYNSKNESEA